MKSIRVLLVCSIGGFIGSVIALEIYQGFWWVGTVVGALVAYLGYDIEEVITSTQQAYVSTINWRPNRQYWSCWREGYVYLINLGLNVSIFFYFVLTFIDWSISDSDNFGYNLKVTTVAILFFLTLFSIISLKFADEIASQKMKGADSTYNCPNCFRFYFWILPKSFIEFILEIPKILMVVKDFLLKIFQFIHSEVRLLCTVNTAIGTAVGYFMGSAIIGAVTGGLLGFVAYEIITVRFLKLSGEKSLFQRKFK